jgi:DNA-binding IclR family transcriptional regulator
VSEELQPVRRAARLLRTLAAVGPLRAAELSARLALPYATCHRLLRALQAEALVQRDATKRYRVAALPLAAKDP